MCAGSKVAVNVVVDDADIDTEPCEAAREEAKLSWRYWPLLLVTTSRLYAGGAFM